jgi:hypothetical protein
MPMERQGTCLGNVLRKIKEEEVRLTFQKHRGNVEAEGAEDGRSLDVEEGSLKTKGRS